MECIVCKKQLTGQQQKFCSKTCKYQYGNSKRKKTERKAVCPECGRDFVINLVNKKYCSNVCMIKFNRRKYYQNNKDKWTDNWKNRTINRRIEQFGINEEEYNKMVEMADGKCEICGEHFENLKKSLCVDHCHATGKIRGLLCDNCNIAIGRLKDSIDNAKNAIKYLEKYNY